MKTTKAFRALNSRRDNERNASMKFLVKQLTKAGAVSKSFTDWRFNAFVEQDAAEKRAQYLESLNPGSKYVVVPV